MHLPQPPTYSIAPHTRRGVLQGLGAASLGVSLALRTAAQSRPAEPAPQSPRIAMVTWRGETDVEKGFREYVHAKGWTPKISTMDAAQDKNRLRVIAATLLRSRPDLVYSWGTPATLGLIGSYELPDPVFASQIPHVFALVADPRGVKLVRDLANPDRRVTGVSHVPSVRAQWQAMSSYGRSRHLAMLFNRAEPNSVAAIKDWQSLAQREGITVDALPFPLDDSGAPTVRGVDGMLAGMKARGADWLVLGPDTYLFSNLDMLSQAALGLRLPCFASTESQIAPRYPVLAGLVSKFLHVGQFAGYKAQQLLSRKPGSAPVPIETLKRFAFVVRLNTAQQLGMWPPMALMDYAEFR